MKKPLFVKLREHIREISLAIHYVYLTKIYKMDIERDARVSILANLDKTFPSGIHIGNETRVTRGVFVLSHDRARGLKKHTYIGKRCFIGVNVIVMPGIKIGDEVVIGAGSVVTKNIPSNSIAVGNPAKVIKSNIMLSESESEQNN